MVHSRGLKQLSEDGEFLTGKRFIAIGVGFGKKGVTLRLDFLP